MRRATHPLPKSEIFYPESDGRPMADNTVQYRWITTIKGNLDFRLPDFVAGDLLWYPVEGSPEICRAPDVLVALGRPKGDRGSYKQWEEGGVAPQIVFEILSPNNSAVELVAKIDFYTRYGVEEIYVYDPDRHDLAGWLVSDAGRSPVLSTNGWTSPRLGIRFETGGGELVVRGPEGAVFESFEAVLERASTAEKRIEEERQRADAERQRADALAARLREMGVDV